MDNLTKDQRRKNMQAIRSKNTKIECVLASALWSRGLRYRKHNKKVYGKPDFTFKKYRIAIFVDSEFWHGKDWNTNCQRLDTNKEYWLKKISGNIARDQKVNEYLISSGWKVLRFWSKDIAKNLAVCVSQIENEIRSLRTS